VGTEQPTTPLDVSVLLPARLIEAIAERAAQLAIEKLAEGPERATPYLTIPEAAAYARCKRQRIDDLLSARRLTRYKDGRRTLVRKDELDAWLQHNHHPASGEAAPPTGSPRTQS
jgi:excisionase family DNA binding protein